MIFFFLITWNVCAVTVFVIFYIPTFIWNVLAYETAHHTKFQVPWYRRFIICHTTEKLYIQFVHLVHSILTWMICNRSYILYFFYKSLHCATFHSFMPQSHVKTFLGICHTHLSWNCVFPSYWICHTIRGYHDDIQIPNPFYSR
jgi:hypothetical protein